MQGRLPSDGTAFGAGAPSDCIDRPGLFLNKFFTDCLQNREGMSYIEIKPPFFSEFPLINKINKLQPHRKIHFRLTE